MTSNVIQLKRASRPNYDFYCNKQQMTNSNMKIEDLFESFRRSPRRLEESHDYIQWLFPSSEESRYNAKSKPLLFVEACRINQDADAVSRLKRALQMMTEFWGYKKNTATNTYTHTEMYNEQLRWWGTHNNLRVSRVMKSLCELGFFAEALDFCDALVEDITNPFSIPRIRNQADTAYNYWLGNIKEVLQERKQREERNKLHFVQQAEREMQEYIDATIYLDASIADIERRITELEIKLR